MELRFHKRVQADLNESASRITFCMTSADNISGSGCFGTTADVRISGWSDFENIIIEQRSAPDYSMMRSLPPRTSLARIRCPTVKPLQIYVC